MTLVGMTSEKQVCLHPSRRHTHSSNIGHPRLSKKSHFMFFSCLCYFQHIQQNSGKGVGDIDNRAERGGVLPSEPVGGRSWATE